MRRSVREAGGSGYSAAFTHPDPLDPNDAQRQRTQARSGNFPYDSPVSYGGPVGTDLGGAAYQRTPDHTPPKPRHQKASDEMPYGEYGTAWEQLESLLGTYSPGDQAPDALALGYGSHGRLGEDDIEECGCGDEADDPKDFLRNAFLGIQAPKRHVSGLAGLLGIEDEPEVGLMDVDGQDDNDLYSTDWSERVFAPGAEDDPG